MHLVMIAFTGASHEDCCNSIIQKTMKIHSTCAWKIQVLRIRDLLQQICFGGSLIQSILCLKCVKDVLILDLGEQDQLDIFLSCSTV